MTTLERIVIRLDWEESERGWGVRPDGCSLHLTQKDCERYVKKYWVGMPKEAPDEYSRPSGNPYPVQVSQKLYSELLESNDHSIMLCENNPKGIVPLRKLI